MANASALPEWIYPSTLAQCSTEIEVTRALAKVLAWLWPGYLVGSAEFHCYFLRCDGNVWVVHSMAAALEQRATCNVVEFVERQFSNFGLRFNVRLPWVRACVNQFLVHGVPRNKGCPGGSMGPASVAGNRWPVLCSGTGQFDSFFSHIPDAVSMTFGTVAGRQRGGQFGHSIACIARWSRSQNCSREQSSPRGRTLTREGHEKPTQRKDHRI